jgi:Mn2+/Fe2+ NRAMP family transporter
MTNRNIWKILGPGLLYAGAAVGVSHLVQSTRAGAEYGFELLWILILANFIKYPFFEFGPRYANATGKSLIDGYRKTGKWAVILFVILTISTMFTIQAAVTIVTAGLIGNVFHLSLSPVQISGIILFITMLILMIGRYSVLDKLIKWVIVILATSTIVAVVSAIGKGFHPDSQYINHFSWLDKTDIFFLIAFVGWMPAPIDVTVWQSLWTNAKNRQIGYTPKLREALLDFKIGYIGTAILAICFLSLGAFVLYGSGESLSADGVAFAGQLINMYTSSIGQWAYYFIAVAAITTMFSTTLTCLDAYPRVMKEVSVFFFPRANESKNKIDWETWLWIILVGSGALVVLLFFSSSMRFMVDLATTLSFVTAPFLAVLNYLAVTGKHFPEKMKPKLWLKVYAITGILFLFGFTVFYLYWKL